MSNTVLVVGKSGSGKSRSILNLDHTVTAIINVIGKTFPFRGWKAKYKPISSKDGTGNLLCTDKWESIKKMIVHIDEKRSDITQLIVDDAQYIMANEFMRRHKEKGYDKFTEIGDHFWELLWQARMCRDDLTIVFLIHSEISDHGEVKAKTIGKMLDDKICVEGMFTVVLHTGFEDGNYFFETQTNGNSTAKSPEDMFDEKRIPNDLQLVIDSIKRYEEGE